eukprot:3702954-Lingulodinium_polyedra.AAC.1
MCIRDSRRPVEWPRRPPRPLCSARRPHARSSRSRTRRRAPAARGGQSGLQICTGHACQLRAPAPPCPTGAGR